jgi:hypothetical protein
MNDILTTGMISDNHVICFDSDKRFALEISLRFMKSPNAKFRPQELLQPFG